MVQKQPPEVFFKKRCSQKLSEKVFSCEICEIFKNTYFVEHLQTAASHGSKSDESENDGSYNEG